MANLTRVTATNDITTRTAILRSVTVAGGSAAATCSVRSGGSTGTQVLDVNAVIGSTEQAVLVGTPCPNGIHVTVGGTGAVVTVEWD